MSAQNEEVIGIMHPGASNKSLIFTSNRVIIMKSRSTLVGGAVGGLIMVLSMVFLGILFGLIIGVISMAVISKLAGGPKDFSKVSLESILATNHAEISYSQVEKVEMRKGYIRFLYTETDGKKKKKNFVIKNGNLRQQNVDLAQKVLPGKVILK